MIAGLLFALHGINPMPNFPAVKLTDQIIGIDVHAATHLFRLTQLGLSSLGATQVLRGQPITSAADRSMVARIVAWAISDGAQAPDRG